jgi:endonuclease YncB( thermonuclease family)
MRFSLLLFLLAISPAWADVTGQARVVDGDTIWIGDIKIRLHGIDAPEMKQDCQDASGKTRKAGLEAKDFLVNLIGDQPVSCSGSGKDRYGRLIGECDVNGLDINGELVKSGHAMAYRKYSKRYVDDEISAKKSKAGMWSGSCKPPWEWRRQN